MRIFQFGGSIRRSSVSAAGVRLADEWREVLAMAAEKADRWNRKISTRPVLLARGLEVRATRGGDRDRGALDRGNASLGQATGGPCRFRRQLARGRVGMIGEDGFVWRMLTWVWRSVSAGSGRLDRGLVHIAHVRSSH